MLFPIGRSYNWSIGNSCRESDHNMEGRRNFLLCSCIDFASGFYNRRNSSGWIRRYNGRKSSYGDREKKLEILKDPHTGAFAIISLCCYFLLCVGIFSEMRTERLFAAALVFVFSRSLSGISVVTFQAAKNSGLLRTFQDGAQKRNVRIVLIFWLFATVVGFYLTAGLCGVAAAVVGLAVFFYYDQFSRKQFGGITGDLAGYFLQLCELFMLAVHALF